LEAEDSNINIDEYVDGMSESDAASVRDLYEKVSTAYGKKNGKARAKIQT
jgi:hypothetical protein